MARAPVLAAGGIVLRQGSTPLIAVVRQRKRDEWVLPKGKLAKGETALQAAIREVLEETGHAVSVHEFLGTLAYQSSGGSKFVHFWRMEADGEPVGELMKDIKAVAWLPLEEAIARLSREYERAFLEQVGPLALKIKKQRKPTPPRPSKQQVEPAEAIEAAREPEMMLEPVRAKEPTAQPLEPAVATPQAEPKPELVDILDRGSEPRPEPKEAENSVPTLSPEQAASVQLGVLRRLKSWLHRKA